MSLFNQPPQKICILRLSAIGDVCNTITVVQAIQKHWPTTEITWITGALEAELLKAIPNINVVVFNKKNGFSEYLKVWKQLKGSQFDALLHMQYAIRASLLTVGIKAKYKLGFDAKRSQDGQRLFTNIKVPSPESNHVLDGLRQFAITLGVPEFTPEWSLNYDTDAGNWATSHLSKEKTNLVIVPGASKAYKNWTAAGYVDVINHAMANNLNVILAGSPAKVEIDLGQEIEQVLDTPVTNLIGQSSLLQMLALLDKADVVIAPDTGPTHMANAMGTPVIGLYAHHNPERTGPYNYRSLVVSAYNEALWAETQKQPSQVDWRTRVQDEKAMERITSESVIAMLDKVLKNFQCEQVKA
ncbi:glycosyltransferase family 9 protein [Vibrio natriegens]|uniref:glycosyltransferase family 9 protein n=1 Tax=Vibrio natriegens TaxID=691 RepID=UPI0021E7016A|nr:glycosyltransferase family 9 protein [Vibrio natriegens]UYI47280.1 glycosyltransferase family 9 protein [Vibrio natriegens]